MIEPLISILIPTYQRKELLLETLKSVWRDEAFSYEIIVGDNASTDGTALLCKEFFQQKAPQGLLHSALLEHSENKGMVQNWNMLLDSARGKYVRLLCDDDLLIPGALAKEVAALEKNPDAAICASARLELENRFFILPESTRRDFSDLKQFTLTEKKLSAANALAAMIRGENIFGSPSAVLFRRKALAHFSDQFQYAADWAAWISICEGHSAILLPDPGCWFRLHDENLTRRFVWEGLDIIEGFLLRWRALRSMEKKSGLTLTRERTYLKFALWLKLSRRAAKLLLAGRFRDFFPIPRKVHAAIKQESTLQ